MESNTRVFNAEAALRRTQDAIVAGGYYLVQLHGGTTGIDLPTADATGSSNLATTAGKIALVSSQTDLSGTCPERADIIDLIGYGSTVSCYQGNAAASAPGAATNALLRNDNGCQSRRQSDSDFSATTVSPRNSASPAQTCDRWVLAENIALFYDGWNLVAEVDAGTNTVITKYVHGARIDELISKTTGNSTIYYLADHLGSVRTLTDVNGAIVESYRYEAFGKPTVYNATGTASASSAHGNRFMFTGREFLSEIGIYDYRNRNYSPELGRFLQNDPIRFEAGDVNLYRYVGNDALMITDPTGEFLRAILDFLQNYSDMREANTIGADKYFHCMANCQASSYGGFLGINDEVAAKVISELREYFDEYAKNDSPEVCNEDRAANHHGQDAPDGADCTEWCSEFRPNGLSDDY